MLPEDTLGLNGCKFQIRITGLDFARDGVKTYV